MPEKVYYTKVRLQYEDTIYPVTHVTLTDEEAQQRLERLKTEVRFKMRCLAASASVARQCLEASPAAASSPTLPPARPTRAAAARAAVCAGTCLVDIERPPP